MTTTSNTSLFHKLGGKPAVEAVVEIFYDRVLGDPDLKGFFERTDMAAQKKHQVAFVGMALGGPKDYHGRSMQAAHHDLGIEDRHFDAVAGHLGASLEQAGVGADDIATIIGVVGGLRGDVVGA